MHDGLSLLPFLCKLHRKSLSIRSFGLREDSDVPEGEFSRFFLSFAHFHWKSRGFPASFFCPWENHGYSGKRPMFCEIFCIFWFVLWYWFSSLVVSQEGKYWLYASLNDAKYTDMTSRWFSKRKNMDESELRSEFKRLDAEIKSLEKKMKAIVDELNQTRIAIWSLLIFLFFSLFFLGYSYQWIGACGIAWQSCGWGGSSSRWYWHLARMFSYSIVYYMNMIPLDSRIEAPVRLLSYRPEGIECKDGTSHEGCIPSMFVLIV